MKAEKFAPKEEKTVKSKTPLRIDLKSPLLQREFERLFNQTDLFEIHADSALVLTDSPGSHTQGKNGIKNNVIDFHSFSFPIDFSSLKNAVESASLKQAQEEGKIISIGSMIEINRYERVLRLTPNDAEISLTEKEIAILEMLYLKAGNIVSKEDLLQYVWRYHAQSETHTVETHIYRLRQKLENILEKEELILTDNNGYRLNKIYLS